MSLGIFDEQQPLTFPLVIAPGGPTSFQQLVSSSNLKLRIDAIYLRNWDVIDHVVTFTIRHSAVGSILGSVNVPAAPLTDVQSPVEALLAMGFTAQQGIVLGPYDDIQITTPVAVVSGILSITAVGGTL